MNVKVAIDNLMNFFVDHHQYPGCKENLESNFCVIVEPSNGLQAFCRIFYDK